MVRQPFKVKNVAMKAWEEYSYFLEPSLKVSTNVIREKY